MSQFLFKWRCWIWTVCTFTWTLLLFVPVPAGDPWMIGEISFNVKFFISKTAHLCASFLTMFAGWLSAPMRYRFVLILFLMAHATLTELLQHAFAVLGRSGSLTDVAIDHLGIVIGVGLTWRWWVARSMNASDLLTLKLIARREESVSAV